MALSKPPQTTRNVIPKPLQKPHPPLWVACSNIQTIGQAGKTSHRDICDSLEMFAHEVMPEFHAEEPPEKK